MRPSPALRRRGEFNWAEAEAELRDVLPPRFVTPDGGGPQIRRRWRRSATQPPRRPPTTPSDRGLRLADVAGLAEVKARLEAAFLAPMRNPELRKLYGKSLRGGLLLYGPPGCGKTFIARAVAGELGAKFMAVSFADVVDMYIGSSERNIKEIFDTARQNAPCVVFLDEVDAIGQKRSQLRSTPHAQRREPAAARAGRRHRRQRGRLRAGGHQPSLGCGQRPAAARPAGPDAAGAAAR